MKVAFVDFHEGFNPSNNIFINCIRHLFGPSTFVDDWNDADVIFFTIFGPNRTQLLQNFPTKSILWIGENIRPNTIASGYSISTDFSNYGDKNFRLPLWFLEIDWHNTGLGTCSLADVYNRLVCIGNANLTDLRHRKFCITIFNNPEGTRIEMLRSIREISHVDCYGKPFGNWFPTYSSYKDKLAKMSDYCFNLCPENSIYPGYYTEKAFHAKLAGTIPLYFADKWSSLEFRPISLLNLHNYPSIQRYAQYVEYVYRNDQLLLRLLNQPLLATMPSLSSFYKWLYKTINTIMIRQ